jgi:CheY-like chemotaxis protein
VLDGRRRVVAFAVTDTGIGIPPTSSAHLRGVPAGRRRHQPQVRRHRPRPGDQPRARRPARRRDPAASTPGEGSTFTLYLPLRYAGPGPPARRRPAPPRAPRRRGADAVPPTRRARRACPDDRETSSPATTLLLIVEDDPHYARVLLGLARDRASRCSSRTAARGAGAGREYRPTAISLDVFLPDMLGWTVLNQLKQDPPRATSRCRSSPRGGAPARPRARRLLLPGTSPPPRARAALERIKDFAAAHASACWWSRTTRRAAQHRGAARHTTTSRSTRSARRRGAAALRDSPSTAWCSTCGCPT